ncbi:MAG: GTPase ObgE [Bacteroidia bacterium]|nr:GTPase ObgE [Bacteroidia bacterium]
MASFVDYVKLYLTSGKGGDGVISWRKEMFVPKGGPDGGDGGKGGDIVMKGNTQMWTLLDLKYRKHIKAESGGNGAGQKKTGKSGKDQVLEVPLGTIARDSETGEFLGEVTQDNERIILLKGGYGGRGNWNFRSATNQSPEYATPGGYAQEKTVILELKTLADVGLVGFPNAGKSTLLSVVSAARPKVADYAFTTLVPNLGIVAYRDHKSFVMADIPGIIEDAHKGKGLGFQFLRHIERNNVLLFMVPCDSDDICKEYKVLLNEVELYNPELLKTPRLLAITKSDMIDEELKAEIAEEVEDLDIDVVFISSIAQKGLIELKDRLWEKLNEVPDFMK